MLQKKGLDYKMKIFRKMIFIYEPLYLNQRTLF